MRKSDETTSRETRQIVNRVEYIKRGTYNSQIQMTDHKKDNS